MSKSGNLTVYGSFISFFWQWHLSSISEWRSNLCGPLRLPSKWSISIKLISHSLCIGLVYSTGWCNNETQWPLVRSKVKVCLQGLQCKSECNVQPLTGKSAATMQEYRLVVKRELLKKSVKTVVEETALGINKQKYKNTGTINKSQVLVKWISNGL